MKNKIFPCVVLISTLFACQNTQTPQPPAPKCAETISAVEYVVVTRDIKRGEEIKAADLDTIRWTAQQGAPNPTWHKKADLQQLTGQFAKQSIREKAFIHRGDLQIQTGPPVKAPDLFAYTISATKLTAIPQLKVGDTVTLMGVYLTEATPLSKAIQVSIPLKFNVKVIGVENPCKPQLTKPCSGTQNLTVTVEVDFNTMNLLMLSEERGKLRVVKQTKPHAYQTITTRTTMKSALQDLMIPMRSHIHHRRPRKRKLKQAPIDLGLDETTESR